MVACIENLERESIRNLESESMLNLINLMNLSNLESESRWNSRDESSNAIPFARNSERIGEPSKRFSKIICMNY
jgi:hypothetical protein